MPSLLGNKASQSLTKGFGLKRRNVLGAETIPTMGYGYLGQQRVVKGKRRPKYVYGDPWVYFSKHDYDNYESN